MAMRRGPRNTWSIPHVAPASREPAEECVEDGCERPAYLDGRCKKHRDFWLYTTGRLGDTSAPYRDTSMRVLHPDIVS